VSKRDGALSSHPPYRSVISLWGGRKFTSGLSVRSVLTLKDSQCVALAAPQNAYPLPISTYKKAQAQLQQAQDEAPNAPQPQTLPYTQAPTTSITARMPYYSVPEWRPRPSALPDGLAHSRTSARRGAMRSSSSPWHLHRVLLWTR
jgi:hypothetical protein